MPSRLPWEISSFSGPRYSKSRLPVRKIDAVGAERGVGHEEDVALSGYAIHSLGDHRIIDEVPAHAVIGVGGLVIGAVGFRGIEVHGANGVFALGPEGQPVVLGSFGAAAGIDKGEAAGVIDDDGVGIGGEPVADDLRADDEVVEVVIVGVPDVGGAGEGDTVVGEGAGGEIEHAAAKGIALQDLEVFVVRAEGRRQ